MEKGDPFKYFKTSLEIIRLAVILYVRFPLSLRNVEDFLHERGINVSHEAVRYWWHRFGPLQDVLHLRQAGAGRGGSRQFVDDDPFTNSRLERITLKVEVLIMCVDNPRIANRQGQKPLARQ